MPKMSLPFHLNHRELVARHGALQGARRRLHGSDFCGHRDRFGERANLEHSRPRSRVSPLMTMHVVERGVLESFHLDPQGYICRRVATEARKMPLRSKPRMRQTGGRVRGHHCRARHHTVTVSNVPVRVPFWPVRTHAGGGERINTEKRDESREPILRLPSMWAPF